MGLHDACRRIGAGKHTCPYSLHAPSPYHAKRALALLLLLLVVPLAAAGAVASEPASEIVAMATPEDLLRSELAEVFALLSSAEEAGANVDAAAATLNQALALIDSGTAQDLMAAEEMIQQVASSIPGLIAEGESAQWAGTAGLAATLAALAVAAALVYFFMPRLVWRLWSRGRKDWRVSAQ